ncbi:fused MFS/spermidine synthase [Actinopolymorpha rutila]|uniref:Spermidine synthase n=1 Tax=Actinopolymorpha rutila TaxID=446787 RepID=A0A852ZAE1_9ACTN|nr:spermidine synthase [Actinopolymorpha rutila]
MPDRRPPARTRRATNRGPAGSAQPAVPAGTHPIDTGEVILTADPGDPGGWFVIVNGVPSSYVHLGDPTRLDFEYVRWTGDILDHLPPGPLRVAHLGGAGCTLARYVTATRPGSRQVVFEIDGALVDLVREGFGLVRDRGIRVRTGDARAGLASLRDGSQDVVIRDAFTGNRVPGHLTTLEFAYELVRVLEPSGVYVANVADRTEQRHARAEAATLREVFAHVALIAEPSQLRGRRYGNVLLLASNGELPLDGLTRRLASGAVRARLVLPDRVAELVAGLRPLRDPSEPVERDEPDDAGDSDAEGEQAQRRTEGRPA